MYISFIAIGSAASAIVYFFQKLFKAQHHHRLKKFKFLFLIILSFLFVLFGLLLFLFADSLFLDQEHWYNRSPYFQMLLFLFMILGMASQYFYNAVLVRRNKIAKLKENEGTMERKPKIEFDMWEFSLPMFVSVMTYGALLSQIEDEQLTISNVVLSYQTGFFWQTILKPNPAQSG